LRSDFAAILQQFTLIALAIAQRFRNDLEVIAAISQQSQGDFAAISKRFRSNHKATAQRFHIDCAGDCAAITQ
jgi:hypothetical protein